MADFPIHERAPMIRALLREAEQIGTGKTQTRRLAWKTHWAPGIECEHGYDACPICDAPKPTLWQKVKPGDRLWVRETCVFESCREVGWYEPPFGYSRPIQVHEDLDWGRWWLQPHYRATDPAPDLAYDDLDEPHVRWRSSIHMPRWASRLTLCVTDARRERLQEISEDDARAEGGQRFEPYSSEMWWHGRHGKYGPAFYPTALASFAWLWNSTHGPDAWDQNPEVVALTFTVHTANIDQLGEQAA